MEHLQFSLFTSSETQIEQLGDCTVYTVNNSTGSGKMTDYPVFSGIHLIYNDFHMRVCPCDEKQCLNCIELNHCCEGRIEIEYNGKLYYLGKGDFALASKDGAVQSSYFPLAHYHGISIVLDGTLITDETVQLLKSFSIDIVSLYRRYYGDGKCVLLRDNTSVEHIFAELYTVHDSVKISYLKVKVIELLLFLSVSENFACRVQQELYPAYRVEKVKKVREYIETHLDERFTVEELADKFRIPLTAMKLCFRAVYGMPVASFIRSMRIQQASCLLRTTELSVMDIAGTVGYDNASKFASAFRGIMNCNPVEYRQRAM
ncbi:MAG TPA: AraC family transcriptional regulator [Treponema sp.]|nr:AraC family transcriptional regulator [Treponema sp.]